MSTHTRLTARTSSGRWRVLGYAIALAGLALTWQAFATFVLPYDLIGNDGVTYLAAAERLAQGHDLYRIAPGDRLVFGLGSPCCPFPLMSPPPVAVLFLPLTILGPHLAVLLWDWVNAVAIVGTVGYLLVRLPLPTGICIVALSLPLAVETLLGNVNGLLLAGTAVTWMLAARGRSASAGALVGIMAAVKLWPAVLILWFLTQRRYDVLPGFVAGIFVVGLLSLAGAGIDAHFEWLTVVVPASVGQAPFAVFVEAGTGVHLPWIGYAILLVGSIEVWALRSRPRIAWAATVLTMVFGAPVFHVGTLILLFAALIPWADRSPAVDIGAPSARSVAV